MSWKFNPLKGNFDYFESPIAMSFNKANKLVDSAFLVNKELILDFTPLLNSDLVFLNGLLLTNDCYTIVDKTITFLPTLPFKVGHEINIQYAS